VPARFGGYSTDPAVAVDVEPVDLFDLSDQRPQRVLRQLELVFEGLLDSFPTGFNLTDIDAVGSNGICPRNLLTVVYAPGAEGQARRYRYLGFHACICRSRPIHCPQRLYPEIRPQERTLGRCFRRPDGAKYR
jgi:hypothetical protein